MTDKVTVVPYDAAWSSSFALLARNLRDAIGDVAVRIDHIGSTAIPGLSAKPVVDVQVSVRSLEPRDAYQRAIESCGYVLRMHNPDRTKRYFRETPGARRTHIHVRSAGSWSEQFVDCPGQLVDSGVAYLGSSEIGYSPRVRGLRGAGSRATLPLRFSVIFEYGGLIP